MTMLKFCAWIHGVLGTVYLVLYLEGSSEAVARFAHGPLYVLMFLSPVVLLFLVATPIARRFGMW